MPCFKNMSLNSFVQLDMKPWNVFLANTLWQRTKLSHSKTFQLILAKKGNILASFEHLKPQWRNWKLEVEAAENAPLPNTDKNLAHWIPIWWHLNDDLLNICCSLSPIPSPYFSHTFLNRRRTEIWNFYKRESSLAYRSNLLIRCD